MKQRIELVKYPLVIEPTVRVLEILLCVTPIAEAEAPKTHWTMFHRLANRWESPWSTDNNTPHLFGDSPDPDQCKLVLGYGLSGCIKAVYYQQENEWVGRLIPEEATGVVLPMPSLRVVFASDDELELFFDLLFQLSSSTSFTKLFSARQKALIRTALSGVRRVSVAGTLK